jgi:hypothetical protein
VKSHTPSIKSETFPIKSQNSISVSINTKSDLKSSSQSTATTIVKFKASSIETSKSTFITILYTTITPPHPPPHPSKTIITILPDTYTTIYTTIFTETCPAGLTISTYAITQNLYGGIYHAFNPAWLHNHRGGMHAMLRQTYAYHYLSGDRHAKPARPDAGASGQ